LTSGDALHQAGMDASLMERSPALALIAQLDLKCRTIRP